MAADPEALRFGVRWTSDDTRLQVIDNDGNEHVVAELYWPTFPGDVFDLWELGVLISKRYANADGGEAGGR